MIHLEKRVRETKRFNGFMGPTQEFMSKFNYSSLNIGSGIVDGETNELKYNLIWFPGGIQIRQAV
jgi:hypothetical protein